MGWNDRLDGRWANDPEGYIDWVIAQADSRE